MVSLGNLLLFWIFSLSLYIMETIRVGSININGGRDRNKRACVLEIIEQKNLKVIFLQETHTDVNNEVEWAIGWKGQSVFSHGTNYSAGVAVLFSPNLNITVLCTKELVEGRAMMVKVDIEGTTLFSLIYMRQIMARKGCCFLMI